MCTRFVYRGDDIITGFNFDIDLAVWNHKVRLEKDRFFIDLLRPDGKRHAYHGVNRNGQVGTLLYVHENPAGAYREGKNCLSIATLTESFINGHLDYDAALQAVRTKQIVYAPDATMQAMLSDSRGRTLLIEPGLGYREEEGPYALITNYSLLAPDSTRPFVVPGDTRYERAAQLLSACDRSFSVSDAFSVLQAVRQEEPWATRVSFVYSQNQHTVYYAENGDFAHIKTHRFSPR